MSSSRGTLGAGDKDGACSYPPTQRSPRKRHRQRLSSCLFYTIFAIGLVSFAAMEIFIRWHYSAFPARMKQSKIDFAAKQAGRNLKKGVDEEVRYPTMRVPRFSVHSPNRSTHHEAVWPLDPLIYVPSYGKSISQPRVFYFDPDVQDASTVILEAQPSTRRIPVLDPKVIDFGGTPSASQEDEECTPMHEWQTSSYPTCNNLHEIDFMQQSHPSLGGNMNLFLTNGYWRNAWKVDYSCNKRNNTTIEGCHESVILKTLKLEHNFTEDRFENNRVDAMAMERLTSSPHVINNFGTCGTSVVTEFADGDRVGTLADSKKKVPLARLKIARDIAAGLADVHSIDGDQEASFVHFDVNLANVVSIGGRLKLNDFNIGVMLTRNVTSGKACGFPAMYPNPQWRSPEEANESRHLTEEVDVFSLGHILFRLVCLHEPWHKLEPGYNKGDEIRKDFVNEQVKKGILPAIPKQVLKTKDAEVRVIREAMLACYTFNPDKRPSARAIANFLDRGISELEKHTFLRKPGKDHWGSFRLGKLA